MRLDLWTLALQAINALVLVWLLARFLYRPVIAAVAQRRAEAARLLADAEAARAQARQVQAALEADRASLAAEAERTGAEARARAAADGEALLEAARAEAAGLRREAQAAILRERAAAQAELERSAAELALVIARRLLELLPPAALTEAFLAVLAATFAALPEPVQRQLRDPRETVTVVSAVKLDAAAEQACRALLAGAGGVTFATDPALIAGIELRASHATLPASWGAELHRVAAALAREQDDATAA